jgi:hypothetical protein
MSVQLFGINIILYLLRFSKAATVTRNTVLLLDILCIILFESQIFGEYKHFYARSRNCEK